MSDIERREICKCENCGNEAEMVFTCSLPDFEKAEARRQSLSASEKQPAAKKRVKATATCVNCGNEADMWIDL